MYCCCNGSNLYGRNFVDNPGLILRGVPLLLLLGDCRRECLTPINWLLSSDQRICCHILCIHWIVLLHRPQSCCLVFYLSQFVTTTRHPLPGKLSISYALGIMSSAISYINPVNLHSDHSGSVGVGHGRSHQMPWIMTIYNLWWANLHNFYVQQYFTPAVQHVQRDPRAVEWLQYFELPVCLKKKIPWD